MSIKLSVVGVIKLKITNWLCEEVSEYRQKVIKDKLKRGVYVLDLSKKQIKNNSGNVIAFVEISFDEVVSSYK